MFHAIDWHASRGRILYLVIATAFLSAWAATAALAQDKTFKRTPSPPGAAVYFIDIKDGDTIATKTTIHFGLRGMGVAPAGSDKVNSGHHHLLVDTELPPLDQPIPNDFNHLHFGSGQTEAEVTLTPGEHTLQLLLADANHVPHDPPVMSQRIKVKVANDGAAVAPAPMTAMPGMTPGGVTARKPSPKGAKVYFVYPHNGSVIPPHATIRFGLIGMGVAPAGVDKLNTGHHHLLIDTPLPPLDQPIPNDFNHLHFGTGQTEAAVTLPLGPHTLQLLLGDANHTPHDPAVYSAPIKVLVTATGRRPKPAHHPRPHHHHH